MVSDAVRRLLHFCFVHNWGTLTMPTGWSRVMRSKNRLMLPYLASIGLVLQMAGSGASAQNAPDQQNPRTQTAPQDPRSTQSDSRPGETLSERLDRTDGVIRPPATVTPDMPQARPPAPDPRTTPVIPPPGTPGGNPQIEPK